MLFFFINYLKKSISDKFYFIDNIFRERIVININIEWAFPLWFIWWNLVWKLILKNKNKKNHLLSINFLYDEHVLRYSSNIVK